jgi:hypothetical protein
MSNKLTNLNVSEFFFDVYLEPMAIGASAVVDRLRNVTPTKRGRGFSRVLDTVTEAEWNEMYQLAAAVRGNMKGSARGKPLRAAVCAKAMANKMEKLGVDNPVPYSCRASKPRTKKAAAPVVEASVVEQPIITDQVVAPEPVVEQVTTEVVDPTQLEANYVSDEDIAFLASLSSQAA